MLGGIPTYLKLCHFSNFFYYAIWYNINNTCDKIFEELWRALIPISLEIRRFHLISCDFTRFQQKSAKIIEHTTGCLGDPLDLWTNPLWVQYSYLFSFSFLY